MTKQFARNPHLGQWHGETLSDPYHWLRADNWQDLSADPLLLSSDIRAFLEAENVHSEQTTEGTAELQQQLFDEMLGRTKEDDQSVPVPDGPWQYYTRSEMGAQYRLFCRQPRGGGAEQLMLDGNALAEGQGYMSLAAVDHSPDHHWLAVAVDFTGSERYSISLRSLREGQSSDLHIVDTSGDLQWAADSRTLYYTTLDDNHRPDAVWRVDIHGGSPECVYREEDPGFFVSVGETRSGRFIVIHAHDHTTDEQWVLEAKDPKAEPRCVALRQRDIHYDLEDWGEQWIIHTNRQGALDFKLQTAKIGEDAPENWSDWYVPEAGVLLEDCLLYADYLVVEEQSDALPRLGIAVLGAKLAAPVFDYISFDEACYALGSGATFEFDSTELRFHYESPATPAEQWSMNMATGERELLKRQPIPSGHVAADYVTRRCHAKSVDGKTVPVSILHHRDTPLDGTAPGFLYGYGAYGMSTDASFSIARLSMVDRGFVYAIAHVRGGMEKGYQWYLDGKAEKKSNTFDDFIVVAELLIQQELVSPNKLCCYGGSAGGLLVGAVLNERPD
ncbi:MAG: S9 family peptidase, partial [Granulosicoccaceae bacterium]